MRSPKVSRGLSALLCLLSLGACDASGGGGYATNGAPGACESALTCWERCMCSTGDGQGCVSACGDEAAGAAGSGGWPGGSGGNGSTQGGSGGSGGNDLPPSNGGTTGSSGSGGQPNPPDPEPLPVAGLDLLEISAWQSVKIELMREGHPLTESLDAPVVAGRDALLRVYVRTESVWEPRAVEAKLYIDGVERASQTFTPNGESNAGDLSSSINFEVPGSLLTPSATFSVELFELDQSQHSGSVEGSRYPTVGETAQLQPPVRANQLREREPATRLDRRGTSAGELRELLRGARRWARGVGPRHAETTCARRSAKRRCGPRERRAESSHGLLHSVRGGGARRPPARAASRRQPEAHHAAPGNLARWLHRAGEGGAASALVGRARARRGSHAQSSATRGWVRRSFSR